ncbi:hypothetical protein [Klebsiella phage 05F01]|nr:hypothetical protein [Klebsiella phage 05F01]
MKSEQLTMEHFEEFQEHFRGVPKQQVIIQFWEMYLQCQDLHDKVEWLEKTSSAHNTGYLSRCRSSGGITLPPGV